MYWTPAKIVLLADVDEYSFVYAVQLVSQVPQSTLVHGIQYDPVISCHLGPISHRDHDLINQISWK